MTVLPDLNKLDFGTGASEQEKYLRTYFYRSLAFDKACEASTCLILGAKGSGKSAIFRIMSEDCQDIPEFKNPNIFIPLHAILRNDYLFLQTKIPSSVDYSTLWKFYFSTIIAFALVETLPIRLVAKAVVRC